MKEIRAAAAQAHVASPDRVNVVRTTRSAAREKAPTFRPLIPNAVTIEAMREGRRRDGLPRYASVQALFDGLHADD